jgi:hypothetical protein
VRRFCLACFHGGDREEGRASSVARARDRAGGREAREGGRPRGALGDEVVCGRRVGIDGSDRAYFTLVDASLKACSETPLQDPCKTPWDFCCSPPEELAKLSALVQFREGGELVAGNVLGFDGLDHLKNVIVKGKAEKDSSGNLTVVASGIFVR